MKGQVYTIAKLHYVNGVVNFVARKKSTNLDSLAQNASETTKKGTAKHPKARVRTLVRFAEGIGLLDRPSKENVQMTDLGKEYYKARGEEKWNLSSKQRKILRNHVLANPEKTPTIFALNSLFNLVEQGYKGKILAKEYAKAIGKERVWKSDATYEGNTNFGLNYLRELDLIDENLNISMFRPKPVFPKERKISIKKADSSIQLFSENGRKLNAEVTLSQRDEWVDYIFESRGGTKGSPNERNPDYFEALELVLKDAKSKSWHIQDIVVASKKLEDLPLSQKRVKPEKYAYPINLDSGVDIISLRKAISLSVTKVGQKSGSTGGNPTKRIRVTFSKDSINALDFDTEVTQEVLSKFHQKKVNHKFKKSGPPPSGQRKASTIDQNKKGYTYVFKLEGVKENALKIGFTANLSNRLKTLNSQIRPSVTGLNWEPVTYWEFDDVWSAYEFEQEIQSKLRDYLYEGEREIFQISEDDISSILGKQKSKYKD